MNVQTPKITTELLFKIGSLVFLLGVFYQKLDGIDNRVARLERNFDSYRFEPRTASETTIHTTQASVYGSTSGTLITRR